MIVRVDDLPSGSVSVLKKIVDAVGNDGNVYIYGGWLRDYLMREMGKEFAPPINEMEDLDLLIVSDQDPFDLFVRIYQEFPEDLGGLPHPSTLRLFFEKFKIDLTVTKSLRGRVYDFTVNTFYVPVADLLRHERATIRSVHQGLSDLKRRVLRVVEGFPLKDYPHHTLRGLRLIAVYGFTPTPATSRSLREAVRHVVKNSEILPLIHQEVCEILLRGGAAGIDVLDEFGFWTEFFPPLKNLKKEKEENTLFSDRYEHSLFVTKLLWKVLVERERLPKEVRELVRRSAPEFVLQKGLAPGKRSLLYSFLIAALLHDISHMFPEHPKRGAAAVAQLLSERGFYPMERFLISLCVYHHHDLHAFVKGEKEKTEIKKIHPLVLSFLLPFTLCDLLSWILGDERKDEEKRKEVLREYLEKLRKLV